MQFKKYLSAKNVLDEEFFGFQPFKNDFFLDSDFFSNDQSIFLNFPNDDLVFLDDIPFIDSSEFVRHHDIYDFVSDLDYRLGKVWREINLLSRYNRKIATSIDNIPFLKHSNENIPSNQDLLEPVNEKNISEYDNNDDFDTEEFNDDNLIDFSYEPIDFKQNYHEKFNNYNQSLNTNNQLKTIKNSQPIYKDLKSEKHHPDKSLSQVEKEKKTNLTSEEYYPLVQEYAQNKIEPSLTTSDESEQNSDYYKPKYFVRRTPSDFVGYLNNLNINFELPWFIYDYTSSQIQAFENIINYSNSSRKPRVRFSALLIDSKLSPVAVGNLFRGQYFLKNFNPINSSFIKKFKKGILYLKSLPKKSIFKFMLDNELYTIILALRISNYQRLLNSGKIDLFFERALVKGIAFYIVFTN